LQCKILIRNSDFWAFLGYASYKMNLIQCLILGLQMSQSGERFSTVKILLEIACAAGGFAMGLLFAKQLDLGVVTGVFVGLMGAIFTFILAQGLTALIFRILRRD
jgi:hypothetical protein